jgi:hypothetical protein
MIAAGERFHDMCAGRIGVNGTFGHSSRTNVTFAQIRSSDEVCSTSDSRQLPYTASGGQLEWLFVYASRLVAGAALVLFAGTACTKAEAGHGVAIVGPPPSSSSHSPDPTGSTKPTQTSSSPTATPSKKKPTTVSCPGATVHTKTTHMTTGILQHSPDKVSLDKSNSGAQTFATLVHDTYKDVKNSVRFLSNIHYEGGYQNTWSKGTPGHTGRLTEFATLYKFGTPQDACKFAAWESTNFALKPVAGLPGLTAATSHITSIKAYSTEFAVAKGNFVVLSGALVYGSKNAARSARLIMLAQYARV